MKTCPDCKQDLPPEAFVANPRGHDGLQTYCRACCAARGKAWREANKAAHLARKRAYYQANKDALLEQQHRHYEANKARILEAQRKPPEVNRARVKAWAAANPEKRREQLRRQTENLSDGYLRAVLKQKTKLRAAEIPPQLVQMKRDAITLHRMVRKLKEAIHESSKDTDRISGEHGAGCNAGRLAPDRGEQLAGAGTQRDQRHGRGSDGQGPGLDQQQPER